MLANRSRTSREQKGATLVELMIAMAIGLLVMMIAIQVFLDNRKTYRLNASLARVQEIGRFAMYSISREIRMAGFVGCSSRSNVDIENVADNNPPTIDMDRAVVGFDNGDGWWTELTPPQHVSGYDLTICDSTGGGNAICQASDIFTVLRASETAAVLAVDTPTTTSNLEIRETDYNAINPAITVSGNPPSNEDLILVTDCETADLFRATSVTISAGNARITPNAALQVAYSAGATLTPIVSSTYFIADDGLDENGDGSADPLAELYRMGVTDGGVPPSAIPIAHGVEMMNVRYGVNTTGDEYADLYVNAGAITDWSTVVSVRVSILIKSREDFVVDEAVAVTFVDGTVVNSGANADRRLRMVYSTTIGLRNRLP